MKQHITPTSTLIRRDSHPRPRAAVPSGAGQFSRFSDEDLMLLVNDGDMAAFDALVGRHRAAVLSLARYACGPELAEEVAQAAFMSLWQHCTKYSHERGAVRSWLLAIVRHRGIDLMRSRASRQRLTISADPHGWMVAVADQALAAEPPQAYVEREESRVEVQRLLATLPPAQRAVIEMAYLDGLSQQEIALKLGIPLGTVKGRLRLGLEKLRVAWGPRDQRVAPAPAAPAPVAPAPAPAAPAPAAPALAAA